MIYAALPLSLDLNPGRASDANSRVSGESIWYAFSLRENTPKGARVFDGLGGALREERERLGALRRRAMPAAKREGSY